MWEGSSTQSPFHGHSVQQAHEGGHRACLWGVLLLSLSELHLLLLPLHDLSLCLVEMQQSSVSQLSGSSLARGEQDEFLLLVESEAWGEEVPEVLLLVLHDSSSKEELCRFYLM